MWLASISLISSATPLPSPSSLFSFSSSSSSSLVLPSSLLGLATNGWSKSAVPLSNCRESGWLLLRKMYGEEGRLLAAKDVAGTPRLDWAEADPGPKNEGRLTAGRPKVAWAGNVCWVGWAVELTYGCWSPLAWEVFAGVCWGGEIFKRLFL